MTTRRRQSGSTSQKDKFSAYKGGDIEIQNLSEEYLFRGPIEQIELVGTELKVNLSWVAKGVGYPPLPKEWVADANREYVVDLQIYSVSDIGNGRTCLQSSLTGELTVLFPPGGNKLDPSNVKGLKI